MISIRSALVLAAGATLISAASAQAMPYRLGGDVAGRAPKCAHHGVVVNAAGHSTCGLHKGSAKNTPPPTLLTATATPSTPVPGDQSPPSSTGDQTGLPTDQGDQNDQGDQTGQSDQGDQNDQGDVNDQGDQGGSGSSHGGPGADQGDQNDQGGGSSSDQGNQDG
jgi:transcription termination factor Rho